MAGVRRASDARPRNFIGAGQETSGYAVTDDAQATHLRLGGVGLNGEGHLDNASFFAHWLIAYPIKSTSYSQRGVQRQSFGGRTNHEHDTGGEQHGR